MEFIDYTLILLFFLLLGLMVLLVARAANNGNPDGRADALLSQQEEIHTNPTKLT